jgi:flagellar hook-basal body complex protein FliE
VIVPPVGGVGGELAPGPAEALTKGSYAGQPEGPAAAEAPAEGLQTGGGVGAPSGEGGSFGGALTDAISSLEKTQQSADAASQALATGTVKDPESAVVTVEDAQLAMQLAAQIRTKATEAAQSIFQTQV